MKKLAANSLIHADGACNIMDVAADPIAEIGDFVDEGNLGREKSVGCVLGELSSFERSNYEGRFDQAGDRDPS